jgi:hypothetical protein
MDRRKASVVVAVLALAVPAAAGAGDPGPDDPVDPPLYPLRPVHPTTTPSTSTSTAAALRVVASAPLRLRVVGFQRNELVRVTVTATGSRLVRQMRAGAKGGFWVTFAGVRVDECSIAPREIVARGSSTGRVAMFALPRACALR